MARYLGKHGKFGKREVLKAIVEEKQQILITFGEV